MSGGAIAAIVAGALSYGCAYYSQHLDKSRNIILQTPSMTNVKQVYDELKGQSTLRSPSPFTYAALDLYSTTHDPSASSGVILRDTEVTQVIESWEYKPAIKPVAAAAAAHPPGGAIPHQQPPQQPSAPGTWTRKEEERLLTDRASNREVHALLLKDWPFNSSSSSIKPTSPRPTKSLDTIFVNPASLERWMRHSDLWTSKSESFTSLPSVSPFIPPSVSAPVTNVYVNTGSGNQQAPPPQAEAVPIAPPPRVIGHRSRTRELRVNEPIFALGWVQLNSSPSPSSSSSSASPENLTFTTEGPNPFDPRPTMLRAGTRQAYLDNMRDESQAFSTASYVFGGISIGSALYWILSSSGR